jgi:hypothetical protein
VNLRLSFVTQLLFSNNFNLTIIRQFYNRRRLSGNFIALQHSPHLYNLRTDFFKTFGVGCPEIFAEVETNGFSSFQ